MERSRRVLLIAFLLLLTACGSETASPSGSLSTPGTTPTPTQGVTPTPTIPDVPSRLVHFSTEDHIQLGGLLYGHGKTAVICSHELRTTKAIWSDSGVPQRLASRGYLVLAYDFRGNGDSAGQADTSKLDVDLRAAVAFVHQQGAKNVVLLGSSMGGTATLKVAASEPVTAIITLSAPQNFGPGVSDAEVKAIRVAKLFINSENDDYTSDTKHMYEIASSPKELHLYPGNAHGTDNFAGEDLEQRIQDFITHYAPAK